MNVPDKKRAPGGNRECKAFHAGVSESEIKLVSKQFLMKKKNTNKYFKSKIVQKNWERLTPNHRTN